MGFNVFLFLKHTIEPIGALTSNQPMAGILCFGRTSILLTISLYVKLAIVVMMFFLPQSQGFKSIVLK